MAENDGTRRNANLGGERHDGQNESGKQMGQFAADSNHNDTTDDCDRCPHLHDCLFDDGFEPICESQGNQLTLFECDDSNGTDEANDAYTDPTGRVYAEADVLKAKLEKFPRICEWFKTNRNVLRWFDSGFLELASIANGPEVSGNVLVYHLRFVGIRDARGYRQKRRVRLSNDVNPVLARTLAILHPDKAGKLRMNPCVWDVPALQPLVRELAELA